MHRLLASPSRSSSSQQLPQIRTDTDTSSLDPGTKSLSVTSIRPTIPPTQRSVVQTNTSAASANISTPSHTAGALSDQQQPQQGLHTSSHSMLSPQLPASNTSMSFSSVDDTGAPRRHSNPHPCGGNNTNHNGNSNSNNSIGGRGSQQSPQQRRRSDDNSVMDAVSRSLNAHNDPELEGLPPIGEESSADGSTLLYEKGFLISTSPGTDRDPGMGNNSGQDYLAVHLQDEEQQQQQQGPNSTSRSRGPAANASGISHRLLTAEEIQERRRATSRPVSQAASRAVPGVADSAKSVNNNNSVSLSTSGKPAHRQLSKEETEKLIAQRQKQLKEQKKLKEQQRAAAAAAHSTPQGESNTNTSSRQQNTPQQSYTASANNNNSSAGVANSAPLNSNPAPWLMAGDGTQGNLQQTEQQQCQQRAQQQYSGTVTFEWLRGASSGMGSLMDQNARSWLGANPWRDAATTAATTSPAFFSGAGGVDFGDGVHTAGVGLTMANVTARGGTTPGGGAYTWLPNTSYWPSLEQQQEQQQQQQSALIPSIATMAAAPHDAFAFIPHSQALLNTAGPLGSGNAGGTSTTANFTSCNNNGIQIVSPLADLTLGLLQSLPISQIESGIRQCNEQILRAQQDREVLYHELQRRQYPMSSGNIINASNNNNPSITSGGAPGGNTTTEAMSWPGALYPTTTTATTNTAVEETGGLLGSKPSPAGGSAASTGSPSRFFNGPGVESLPQTLDVPTSVLHTAAGQNFSTTSSTGGSSMNANAAAVTSDGPAAASLSGPLPAKPAGGWGGGERFNSANNNSNAGNRGPYRNHNRSHGHSSIAEKSHHGGSRSANNNNSTSFGGGAAATAGCAGGGAATTGTRCSHDNTPQEQKYLQTDPFSMYEHNKKIAMTTTSAAASTVATAATASQSEKDGSA